MKEIKNDNFKDVNKLEFKCTCKHCGCQFEYSDSDTGWDKEEVECPNCGTYCKHRKYLNSLDNDKRATGEFGIIVSIVFALLTLIVFSILLF